MSYATPEDFLSRADKVELYQRLLQNNTGLTLDVLMDAIAGADLSAYPVDEQDAAAAALARLNELLDDAGGVVDSYLGGLYTTPLSPVPRGIETHVINIALFNLYGNTAREGDPVETRYKGAIRFLEMVAKGVIKIGADATGVAPGEAADEADFSSGESIFGRSAYA